MRRHIDKAESCVKLPSHVSGLAPKKASTSRVTPLRSGVNAGMNAGDEIDSASSNSSNSSVAIEHSDGNATSKCLQFLNGKSVFFSQARFIM